MEYLPFEKLAFKQDVKVKEISDIIVSYWCYSNNEKQEKYECVRNCWSQQNINITEASQTDMFFTTYRIKNAVFEALYIVYQQLKRAENNWIRHVQKDLPDDNEEIHDRDHAEVDVTIGNF